VPDLFLAALVGTVLRLAAPLIWTALGGSLTSRLGIFNVSLEGTLLVASFGAVAGAHFGGSLLSGLLGGLGAALGFSILFGVVVLTLRADAVVAGLSLNVLALGGTAFGLKAWFHSGGAFYDKNLPSLAVWDLPGLQGLSVLVLGAGLAVVALEVFLRTTVGGSRFRLAGQNAEAARALGLPVQRYRWTAVVVGGLFCGVAGIQLALGQVALFSEGMSAGRGFIALVAVMLARDNPTAILGACLLFALTDALGLRLQAWAWPSSLTQMIPYFATLAALILVSLRQRKTR
jgi:simple sugar transport system permease protein